MGTYIPNTEKEQTEMLKKSGYKDFDDLFKVIPDGLKLNRELNLPGGSCRTKQGVSQHFQRCGSI